ncbi:MAG: bifunctional (p)ppGpp synthetase/guanosine-3',5'-bis(diphosphate) 3'-pyrophosphohydrolase, partial [Armatimonadetes bacterium]|nr:bifunctional (p)ppGpp synthetase/guanosine-3',5'-bis(diphosphate) 3'-pyrophosphohydrolase [Armatimonadota bacterium]
MATAEVAIPDSWIEPEALTKLLDKVREQRPRADMKRLRRAYYLAETAHRGQERRTGDPYISHPLAVANILADLRMDETSIIAALLHDTIEDTEVTPDRIQAAFSKSVRDLVEGVTKMKFPPPVQAETPQRAAEERARFAESMRKMLMAMAADFRVMVIKLADRMHNMQTLYALPKDKQKRIAQETLDIFSPLAARLGIWQIKWQLEDLAFKYLHPDDYERVRDMVAKTRQKREEELADAMVKLKERLEQAGLEQAEVQGRPKHLHSIYQKMVVQGFDFEEIYDLLGLRIIVDTESDCYKVLGLVHEMWMPIPGLFYDYIAKPKSNGYQSLHTKVVGPHGEPLEAQIRTFEMHQMAEFGIAAHWQYKPRDRGRVSVEEQARFNRLRQQLFDWSRDALTGSEFLRSVSTDLFSEQVFTFTPKGDVVDLPRGATPIDFAFRIHTEIGLKTVGAKVNGRIVKLDKTLDNGDIVEILTRGNAQPSVDWLRYAKSANARSRIRAFLRQQNREANAQRGREALERELNALGFVPRHFLAESKLSEAAKGLRKKDAASLLAAVGEGLITVRRVVNRLTVEERKKEKGGRPRRAAGAAATVSIGPGGMDNIAFRRSKCCLPVPGDETVGYVSKGRGVILHRKLCPNVAPLVSEDPDR